MIKNYEIRKQVVEDSDSEDENAQKKVKGIGVRNTKREKSEEEKMREDKQVYKDLMKALISETRFNYLGCNFFQRQNKILYLGLVICQLAQTMVFNGLFDIPQLFILLALSSWYAYRRTFPVAYGLVVFFLVYYI
jgi:hypothetical protein